MCYCLYPALLYVLFTMADSVAYHVLTLGNLWPNDDDTHIALRGLPNYNYCPDNDLLIWLCDLLRSP